MVPQFPLLSLHLSHGHATRFVVSPAGEGLLCSLTSPLAMAVQMTHNSADHQTILVVAGFVLLATLIAILWTMPERQSQKAASSSPSCSLTAGQHGGGSL